MPLLFAGRVGASSPPPEPAQLVDVVPTVLAQLGIETDGAAFEGSDLFAAAPHRRRPVFAAGTTGLFRRFMVLDSDTKLILSLPRHEPDRMSEEIFDVAGDPGEHEELGERADSAERRRLREALARHLAAGAEGDAPSAVIDAERRAELEALGYLE